MPLKDLEIEETTDAGAVVDPFYERHGSATRARPDDLYFLARTGGKLVGCVRYCEEEGTRMLRSMLVDEGVRGHGVGLALLDAFENALQPGAPVYCVPYSHLEKFYERIGFQPVDDGPQFLLERIKSYRARGLQVILMKRASSPGSTARPRPPSKA